MKKIIIILMVFLLVGCSPKLSDAEKFKKEYESLNGQVNDNGLEYFHLDIDEDNKVVYLNDSEEVIEALTHGTKVVYFGFNNCPWCRQLVPLLLEEVNKYVGIKVYYYDFKALRENYLSKENEKLVAAYEEIMNIIGEFNPYEFQPKQNVSRLVAPTLVFIKNGEVIGMHIGTLDEHENGYILLTGEQKERIKEILDTYLNQIIDTSSIGCHDC